MNDPVRDSLAALLADPSLVQLVAMPTVSGYGVDLICYDDLTATLGETDPSTTASLAQDNYHRLITDPGSLPDDQDYGLGLESFLSRGTTLADLQLMSGQIETELRKDDRNASVSAVVSVSGLLPTTLSVTIQVTPADPDLEPFTLLLAVDSAGVFLSSVS